MMKQPIGFFTYVTARCGMVSEPNDNHDCDSTKTVDDSRLTATVASSEWVIVQCKLELSNAGAVAHIRGLFTL